MPPRSKLSTAPIEAPKVYRECPTVAEYYEVFLSTHVAKNNKASERDKKRQVFKSFIVPMLGQYRLDEIDMTHIDVFQARQIEAGLSPKTVNNRVAILAKMLRFAQERKVLARMPAIEMLKVDSQRVYFLSVDKVQRLYKAAAEMGPLVLGLVTLAVNTGMRKSEIQALKWENVSTTAAQLHVLESVYIGAKETPKSKDGTRTLPLNEPAIAALRGLERLGPLVFSRPPRGARLSDWFMKETMVELKKRTGLRKLGWHVLRHTFASHMAMGGVPMPVLKYLMGHSDIKMTMRYVHLSPESKSKATDILASVFKF